MSSKRHQKMAQSAMDRLAFARSAQDDIIDQCEQREPPDLDYIIEAAQDAKDAIDAAYTVLETVRGPGE